MLIWALLSAIGLITIVAIRHWCFSRLDYSKSAQKALKQIAQHISLQEWEKARKCLLSLPDRKNKEALLCEIEILIGEMRPQEALEIAEEASRLFPEELHFRLLEAQCLLEQNRPEEALAAFQVCAPILRKEYDLLTLASALCRTGYTKEALDILNQLPPAQNGYRTEIAADAFYTQKNFPEAIAHYKKAIELKRPAHRLYLQIGHAHRRQGHLSEAETCFKALLDNNCQDIDAALGLGACLQERGAHHKAFLIYQTALCYSSRNLKVSHQAAFAALRAKKYDFAEKYLFEVLQNERDDPQLYAYYGYSQEMQQKWIEAESSYLRSIERFPAYCPGYRALAWLFGVGLSQRITKEQALHFAHLALKLKNDPLSWEILSAVSARIGEFDQAYQIQQLLAKQDKEPEQKARRQELLRHLRKKLPLGHLHIIRAEVA